MKLGIDMAVIEKIGFRFAFGVLQLWGLFCLALFVLAFLLNQFDILPRDNTDSPTNRSGMALRTDHGTGCQYLETTDGGITPRMGRDGKQVCS